MSGPGRFHRARYRYGTAALTAALEPWAETIYAIAGLYGNQLALDAIETLRRRKPVP